MFSTKNMETLIGAVLIIGTLISAALVFIGGTLYLLQSGGNDMQTELLQAGQYQITIQQILQQALSLSSVGIIELGLLTLVATQILRVAMLVGFYAIIRDYWFTCVSTFILLVLVYSFIWRN